MKFFTKYNVVSIVLMVLFLVVQFLPFTNTAKLDAAYENAGKTWAEMPVGMTGKDKSDWPVEIRFDEFENWDKEIQQKYPLYGEKNVSIFTYVWNPAGSLKTSQYIAYVLIQVLFIAFGLFAFLVKNYMAKAVVAFMFGLGQIYAFIQTLVLKASGFLQPYMAVPVLLLVLGLFAIAVGVFFIPKYFADKKANAELKKSL